MSESSVGQVLIRDTEPQVFMAMLWFMYRGHLDLEERSDYWALLLPLLVLADQFAIQPLQQECCLRLLDCLAEVFSVPCAMSAGVICEIVLTASLKSHRLYLANHLLTTNSMEPEQNIPFFIGIKHDV